MTFVRIALLFVAFSLLTFPAKADFGLLLPNNALVDEPDQTVSVIIGAVNPFTAVGSPLERPQVFTALRSNGNTEERSEHLSVLEETTAYGARAWTTNIALPHPGVYQFIMQSKPIWSPEQDKFVQYICKTQIAAFGSSEGWDKQDNTSFEIIPMTRPAGLCAGMAFTGQALFDDKPIPGAKIQATRLDPSVKPDVTPKPEKNSKKKDPISPFYQIQELRADQQGIFTFVCPLPGWWAFATSMDGDSLQDPEGKQKPVELKTIYWVYIDDCTTKRK